MPDNTMPPTTWYVGRWTRWWPWAGVPRLKTCSTTGTEPGWHWARTGSKTPGHRPQDLWTFRTGCPRPYGGSLTALEKALTGSGPSGELRALQQLSSNREGEVHYVDGFGDGNYRVDFGIRAQGFPRVVSLVKELRSMLHPDTLADPGLLFRPGRKVLILGSLFWEGAHALPSFLLPAAETLLTRAQVHDKDKRNQAMVLLQWAFCHCLHDTVVRQGGELLSQVPYVAAHDKRCAVSGMASLDTLEQLVQRLLQHPDGWHPVPLHVKQKKPVQTALGDPDAVVLDSLFLLQLAEQFLASMDPETFWQESRGLLNSQGM